MPELNTNSVGRIRAPPVIAGDRRGSPPSPHPSVSGAPESLIVVWRFLEWSIRKSIKPIRDGLLDHVAADGPFKRGSLFSPDGGENPLRREIPSFFELLEEIVEAELVHSSHVDSGVKL